MAEKQMVEKQYLYQILTGTFPFTIAQLQMHQSLGREIKIFEGEAIPSSSTQDTYFLYLKTGSLAVKITQPDNPPFRYMVYPAHSVIFYSRPAAVGLPAREWTLYALTNTVAVSFNLLHIKSLLKQDNRFLEQYMDFMQKQQLLLEKRTLMTASLTSSQRILTWLYELCHCVEKPPKDLVHIPCQLSQQDIADILILHTSTCNKSFSTLKQKGIAGKGKNCITVHYQKLSEYIEKDWKIY